MAGLPSLLTAMIFDLKMKDGRKNGQLDIKKFYNLSDVFQLFFVREKELKDSIFVDLKVSDQNF